MRNNLAGHDRTRVQGEAALQAFAAMEPMQKQVAEVYSQMVLPGAGEPGKNCREVVRERIERWARPGEKIILPRKMTRRKLPVTATGKAGASRVAVAGSFRREQEKQQGGRRPAGVRSSGRANAQEIGRGRLPLRCPSALARIHIWHLVRNSSMHCTPCCM